MMDLGDLGKVLGIFQRDPVNLGKDFDSLSKDTDISTKGLDAFGRGFDDVKD